MADIGSIDSWNRRWRKRVRALPAQRVREKELKSVAVMRCYRALFGALAGSARIHALLSTADHGRVHEVIGSEEDFDLPTRLATLSVLFELFDVVVNRRTGRANEIIADFYLLYAKAVGADGLIPQAHRDLTVVVGDDVPTTH